MKLGTVTLVIEKESGSHHVDATQYAVEKGEPFTDHVKKRPSEWSISGYILNDNFNVYLEKLKTMMNNGEVVKYVGKTSVANVIIKDINDDYSADIKNGFALSISLQKVRITTTSWQKAPVKTKPIVKPPTDGGKKKPTGPKKSKEVYHIIKKGDTYWALSRKYGSSIADLRKWNKWDDRKLPINGRARVK